MLSLTATAYALGRDSFFGVLEAEILGGYSEIPGVSSTGSSIDKWTVSPNLKLSDSTYWLNVYYGTFDRSSQVAPQEEGGRESEMSMSHSLSTAIKHNINPDWSLRPLLFVDWVFVNETRDEDFGDGLYDYRDWGGGIESAWTLSRGKDRQNELRLGFRIFDREYPNYFSLITEIGGQEEKEKDFIGYKTNLSYDSFSREGWGWGAESVTLYKDFTDKQTIDFNGIRQGETREDILQYFNMNLTHPVTSQIRFRLDGQFAVNFSNLDFYDTRNTVSLADDHFEKNYFDYYGFSIKPSFIYSRDLGESKIFSVQLSYLFNALIYTDRNVQNPSGAYQSEEERDYTHTLSVRTSYPITPNISWVNLFNYTVAASNQEFEQFYLYDYDLWNILSGISFKY